MSIADQLADDAEVKSIVATLNNEQPGTYTVLGDRHSDNNLKIRCNVCDNDNISVQTATGHATSKQHLKKLAAADVKKKMESTIKNLNEKQGAVVYTVSNEPASDSLPQISCEACNKLLHINSLESHDASLKHVKKVAALRQADNAAPSSQATIDQQSPSTAVKSDTTTDDFVRSVVAQQNEKEGDETFKVLDDVRTSNGHLGIRCTVCNLDTITTDNISAHAVSKSHLKKIGRVADPVPLNAIKESLMTFRSLFTPRDTTALSYTDFLATSCRCQNTAVHWYLVDTKKADEARMDDPSCDELVLVEDAPGSIRAVVPRSSSSTCYTVPNNESYASALSEAVRSCQKGLGAFDYVCDVAFGKAHLQHDREFDWVGCSGFRSALTDEETKMICEDFKLVSIADDAEAPPLLCEMIIQDNAANVTYVVHVAGTTRSSFSTPPAIDIRELTVSPTGLDQHRLIVHCSSGMDLALNVMTVRKHDFAEKQEYSEQLTILANTTFNSVKRWVALKNTTPDAPFPLAKMQVKLGVFELTSVRCREVESEGTIFVTASMATIPLQGYTQYVAYGGKRSRDGQLVVTEEKGIAVGFSQRNGRGDLLLPQLVHEMFFLYEIEKRSHYHGTCGHLSVPAAEDSTMLTAVQPMIRAPTHAKVSLPNVKMSRSATPSPDENGYFHTLVDQLRRVASNAHLDRHSGILVKVDFNRLAGGSISADPMMRTVEQLPKVQLACMDVLHEPLLHELDSQNCQYLQIQRRSLPELEEERSIFAPLFCGKENEKLLFIDDTSAKNVVLSRFRTRAATYMACLPVGTRGTTPLDPAIAELASKVFDLATTAPQEADTTRIETSRKPFIGFLLTPTVVLVPSDALWPSRLMTVDERRQWCLLHLYSSSRHFVAHASRHDVGVGRHFDEEYLGYDFQTCLREMAQAGDALSLRINENAKDDTNLAVMQTDSLSLLFNCSSKDNFSNHLEEAWRNKSRVSQLEVCFDDSKAEISPATAYRYFFGVEPPGSGGGSFEYDFIDVDIVERSKRRHTCRLILIDKNKKISARKASLRRIDGKLITMAKDVTSAKAAAAVFLSSNGEFFSNDENILNSLSDLAQRFLQRKFQPTAENTGVERLSFSFVKEHHSSSDLEMKEQFGVILNGKPSTSRVFIGCHDIKEMVSAERAMLWAKELITKSPRDAATGTEPAAAVKAMTPKFQPQPKEREFPVVSPASALEHVLKEWAIGEEWSYGKWRRDVLETDIINKAVNLAFEGELLGGVGDLESKPLLDLGVPDAFITYLAREEKKPVGISGTTATRFTPSRVTFEGAATRYVLPTTLPASRNVREPPGASENVPYCQTIIELPFDVEISGGAFDENPFQKGTIAAVSVVRSMAEMQLVTEEPLSAPFPPPRLTTNPARQAALMKAYNETWANKKQDCGEFQRIYSHDFSVVLAHIPTTTSQHRALVRPMSASRTQSRLFCPHVDRFVTPQDSLLQGSALFEGWWLCGLVDAKRRWMCAHTALKAPFRWCK